MVKKRKTIENKHEKLMALSIQEPAHIQAVENGLRPTMYLKGKPIVAMNILDRMKHYNVPGLSVAAINNGVIEWAKGYGVKEFDGNDPVTSETLFQAASISKPVIALGTLSLVEKGILDLDMPVNDKLESWKVPKNEFSEKEKVTLRQLLTHSAGLTVSGFPGYATFEQIPTSVQVLNGEKPANTPPVRIDMIPGSQWRYSGGGFVVVQLLVADVSGRPFQEYMKTTVLDPLEMNHSTFEQPLPHDKLDQAATAHLMNGEAVKGRWHTYPELAAAGLWTTQIKSSHKKWPGRC
jgi:CubicO group peptidase (beta-lactamase class C family)